MNFSAPGAGTGNFFDAYTSSATVSEISTSSSGALMKPGAAGDVAGPCSGGRSNIAGTARPGWRSQERGRGEEDDRKRRPRPARLSIERNKRRQRFSKPPVGRHGNARRI